MKALASLALAALVVSGAMSAHAPGTVGTTVQGDTIPPAVIAEGKAIFEGKGGTLCVTCHGKNARGMPGLGPDLTDAQWLHGDGGMAFLQQLIKDGVMKPKQSAAVMPPNGGAALKPEQLRAVAAYVYSLSHRAE
jgi:mono/diheme cytochrome c family protein